MCIRVCKHFLYFIENKKYYKLDLIRIKKKKSLLFKIHPSENELGRNYLSCRQWMERVTSFRRGSYSNDRDAREKIRTSLTVRETQIQIARSWLSFTYPSCWPQLKRPVAEKAGDRAAPLKFTAAATPRYLMQRNVPWKPISPKRTPLRKPGTSPT